MIAAVLAAAAIAAPAHAGRHVVEGAFPVGPLGEFLLTHENWYRYAEFGTFEFFGADLVSVTMASKSGFYVKLMPTTLGIAYVPTAGECTAALGETCYLSPFGPSYAFLGPVTDSGFDFREPYSLLLEPQVPVPPGRVKAITDGVETTFTFDFAPHEGATEIGYRLEYLTDAIPEPSTWAMMILGFGAVGSVLRRRVRVQPAA